LSQKPTDELHILTHDPELIEKLVQSTAPTLIGHSFVKLAALYSLTGGSNRSRISILLVGDAGTGKSHLLHWVAELLDSKVMDSLPPDIYSGPILLENINRLQTGEQMLLEAAIRKRVTGTCEEAGAVIATSRPIPGRYNRYKTVAQNTHLPSALFDLFDLVFVLRDIPDGERDRRVAMKLLGKEDNVNNPVEAGLLRRYLESVRKLNPILSDEARSILLDFYIGLRAQSAEDEPVSITPWQLITLRKLSEARAKLHLRETVSAADAEAAVSMLSYCLEQVGIDPMRRRYDEDVIYSGRPAVLNSRLLQVAETFMELEKVSTPVKRIDLESLLWERYGMTRRAVSLLLRTLLEQGFITEQAPGQYKRKEWGENEF